MATIKTPVSKLKKGETIEHYNAVLLEDIKGKIDQVIEKSDSLEKSLTAKIDDFRNELKKDIGITQHAVSEHTKMIKEVKSEMKEMEIRLSDKIDKVGEKVEGHEIKIAAVEGKLETHLSTHL